MVAYKNNNHYTNGVFCNLSHGISPGTDVDLSIRHGRTLFIFGLNFADIEIVDEGIQTIKDYHCEINCCDSQSVYREVVFLPA